MRIRRDGQDEGEKGKEKKRSIHPATSTATVQFYHLHACIITSNISIPIMQTIDIFMMHYAVG
jgi:hypothetical protein